MVKLLSIGTTAIVLFLSCKKDASVTGGNAILKDTLATGWTMDNINSEQFTNIHFAQNNGVLVSTSAVYVSNTGGESWQHRMDYGNQVLGIGYGWRRNIGMDSIGNVIIPKGIYNGDATGYSFLLSHDYNNFDLVADNSMINDNWFIENRIAYAITANIQDTNIHFLKSIDGGSSWNPVSILPKAGTVFGQIGPTRLAFIDSQTGWASTPYGIFKTTNGGLSWSHLYSPPGIISTISAIDANTCYIQFIAFQPTTGMEIDKISKTTDGGANWQEVFSENTNGPGLGPIIQTFQFVNATTGYLVRGGWVYKSTDGGVNWTRVVSIHSSTCSFTDIYFTDPNHGWACSAYGQIVRYQQ